MWPLVKINPIIKIKNREKNKTLAKTGCVILDRVRIKNVWIHHVDRNIGTKQKQYKKMSLLTSRASHLSAGIASHALLTIMFKDVPLLFLVDPILPKSLRLFISILQYGIYQK